MALPPQKFREIVFQLLFGRDLGVMDADDAIPMLMGELKVTRRAVRDALAKAELIEQRRLSLDEHLAANCQSYRLERMHTAERSALRLGLFELLYDDQELPPKVAISEAMRLARKFGTPEGAQFVNAIMDQVYKVQVLKDEPMAGERIA